MLVQRGGAVEYCASNSVDDGIGFREKSCEVVYEDVVVVKVSKVVGWWWFGLRWWCDPISKWSLQVWLQPGMNLWWAVLGCGAAGKLDGRVLIVHDFLFFLKWSVIIVRGRF